MADGEIEVFVQIDGEDVRAGTLWPHRRRGRESATFAYVPEYLVRPDAYELDPALPVVAGQQQTATRQALFGAFTDCAPDRWGRRLIARARRRRAERNDEAEASPGEIDYLLGVRDDMRQGALRFRTPGGSGFLADEETGVPVLTDLPSLLAASERIERDEAVDDDLLALLRGGSSLGGARPKAHVIEADGRPAIAKFPRPEGDDWEVMRWEATALALASEAGISIPAFRLAELDRRAVLIVNRFDRDAGRRIGYVSAMTMLEASDGEAGSYLEIAAAIETHSPTTSDDLHQLWRRIAFSILISNTDDHLRNHGFLRRSTAGWSLAPAFDLNPDPEPGIKRLSTAIDFHRTEADIGTLVEVAPEFRLDPDSASAILAEVSAATDGWRAVAARYGLARREVEAMAPAFEHDQARTAREIGAAAPNKR